MRDVAHLAPCGVARIDGGESVALELLLFQCLMKRHLLGEIVLEAAIPDAGTEAAEQTRHLEILSSTGTQRLDVEHR